MDIEAAKLDAIGFWSEVKLEILKKYAGQYAKILDSQAKKGKRMRFYYIDAFAGAGVHRSKDRNELVPGSPANALIIQPQFSGYYFIDMNQTRVSLLEELAKGRTDVQIFAGNCNPILVDNILPSIKYDEYRRALCLLDPYGLDVCWEVMYLAGHMETVEIFLNFPIMDMNMNVLKHDLSSVSEVQKKRMDFFWGDRTWEQVAWETESDMFADPMKTTNEAIVKAFMKRLREVAGFKYVPPPLPMRNKTNAVVYYLFYAGQKEAGDKIVRHLFKTHSDRTPS